MRFLFITLCIILSLCGCKTSTGTEIDLSGTWDYCIINSEKDYPPADETLWETIDLPGRYLFEKIAKKRNITRGYILYRKTVTMNRNNPDQLVFQAGEIMNTDMVCFNGKKIGKTGVFPPNFRSGWAKFRNYPIPAEYIIQGENRIDIINYFDAELWVISPVRIIDEVRGNNVYMFRNFIQVEFIHAFCILLLTFSLFFILIYLKRKKETMYLYYAFTTFFLADMMILQFTENFHPYLPLSSNTIYKICGIGPMFFPPFLAFFFRSYLRLTVSLKRIALYLFLPWTFALLMILSQDRYYIIQWRNIFLLLIPLYMADIIIISTRHIMSGNRKGLILFISLIPVFIFGLYDILVFSLHIFEGVVPLYPVGVTFFIILIGVQLVNRFIYNLNESEQLNILLNEKMEEGKRLARLENEVSIARKIQLANVPRSLPELKGFSIGVKYIPAENISGDFYNFHAPERDRLGILIADASGHGIPASLIATMVKILFNTLAPVYSDPGQFIRGLNEYIHDKMNGNLLTAGYCFISREDKKAIYARAGHEPLLHISSRDSVLREYNPYGRIIGFNGKVDSELIEFPVDSGDRIILYTDGLIEIYSEMDEVFGREKFKELLIQSKDLSADESTEFIYRSLCKWTSVKPFKDDFTLIIIDIE